MKEMIYKYGALPEILHTDIYNGYRYVIISYGTHPCAYVEIPKNSPLYEMKFPDINSKYKILCHWGLTFSGQLSPEFKALPNDAFYIGWDYAHCYDYIDYPEDAPLYSYKPHFCELHKYSTSEMVQDAEDVIDQLNEIK